MTSYIHLKKDELIKEGDEVHASRTMMDDAEWETANPASFGKPAPNPRLPAHRLIRRPVVQFTACKFLDFTRESYVPSVQMNLISSRQVTKVCWNRPVEYQLCQFCQKRGRINNPEGCLNAQEAACSDYEEGTHTVPLIDIARS